MNDEEFMMKKGLEIVGGENGGFIKLLTYTKWGR